MIYYVQKVTHLEYGHRPTLDAVNVSLYIQYKGQLSIAHAHE